MTAALRTQSGLAFASFQRFGGRDGEVGRPESLWRRMWEVKGWAFPFRPFGMAPLVSDEGSPDFAVFAALHQLGLVCAAVVFDAPDQVRGRWREAITGEESGTPALIVPVRLYSNLHTSWVRDGCAQTMLFAADHRLRALMPTDSIADLIALPFEGGRAASFSGGTAAIGAFTASSEVHPPSGASRHLPPQGGKVSEAGTLMLAGNGLKWLQRYAGRVRAACEGAPAHVVPRLIEAPETGETLILDPHAFAWRLSDADCVIGADVKRVTCLDSGTLARFIDQGMRARDPTRKPPEVLAPKGAT